MSFDALPFIGASPLEFMPGLSGYATRDAAGNARDVCVSGQPEFPAAHYVGSDMVRVYAFRRVVSVVSSLTSLPYHAYDGNARVVEDSYEEILRQFRGSQALEVSMVAGLTRNPSTGDVLGARCSPK
jgi:hypothetical protein